MVNNKIGYKQKLGNFTLIPNWFLDSHKYSIYEKMVLIVIKKHQGNKDNCWPSLRVIGNQARCSETTVKKAIKGLIEKGQLDKTKSKEYKSCLYHSKLKTPIVAKRF